MANVTQVTLAADSRQIRRGTQDLHRMQVAGKGTASAVATLGKSLVGLAAGAAVVKGLSSSLQAAAKFETGLVGVAKTTGLAGAELDELAERIARLSTEIPVSTEELLGMAQAAGQMGVTGVDNLEKFSTTVAKLGRASDLAGDEAATALARILNVTGENISEIDTLASVIVSLGNNVAATESEIANMTNRIAQATSAAELTSAEIAAMGAALVSMGVRAEAGGTAIGKAFGQMQLVVSQGGEELENFADALDLNGQKFAELFSQDKIKGFEFFLEAVAEKGADAGAALDEAGLGGIRLTQSIIPLAKNLDEYRRTQGLANAEVENATALNREFEATLSTLDSQWITSQNIATEWGRRIGNEVLPDVTMALRTWNSAMRESFREADEAIKGNEVVFVDWGDVVLDTLAFAVDAARGAGNVFDFVFGSLGTQIGGWSAALVQVIQGNFSAAGAIIDELEADIGTLEDKFFNFDASKFRDELEQTRLKMEFKDEIEAAEDLFNALASGFNVFSGAAEESKPIVIDITEGMQDMDDAAGDAGDTIDGVLHPAVVGTTEAFKDFIDEAQRVTDATNDMRESWEDEIRVLEARVRGGEDAARVQEIMNRAQREGLMVTREEAERYVASTSALQQHIQATEDAAQQWDKIWDNAIENMQSAFGNTIYDALWEDGIDSFGDFADAMLDIWKRMIAEMVAAWVTSKIAGFFTGEDSGGFNFSGGSGGGGGNNLTSMAVSKGLQKAGEKFFGSGGPSSTSGAGGSAPLAGGGGGAAGTAAGGGITTLGGANAGLGGGISGASVTGGAQGAGLGGAGAGTGSAAAGMSAMSVAGGMAIFAAGVMALQAAHGKSSRDKVLEDLQRAGPGVAGGLGLQAAAGEKFGFGRGANAGFAADFASRQGILANEIMAGGQGTGIAAFKDLGLEDTLKLLDEAQKEFEALKKSAQSAFKIGEAGAMQVGQSLQDGVIDQTELADMGFIALGERITNTKSGVEKMGNLAVEKFDAITKAVNDGTFRLAALRGETRLNATEMQFLGQQGLMASQSVQAGFEAATGSIRSFGSESAAALREIEGAARSAGGAVASIGGEGPSGAAARDQGLTQQLRDDASRRATQGGR